MPAFALTMMPVLSTKVTDEKSTCFMRDSVMVDEPHSMSALPCATMSKRFWVVTSTHSILSGAFSDLPIHSTASRHRSMV
jgi:hypothetical protein